MIKLIESGLFGDKLLKVDKPIMVSRYNSCLADIGLSQTKLKSFHIDGWGWSPEVAEELKDRYYLSHGNANPYGVIISPEQKNCSLYFPFHSFDWDIHQEIFDHFQDQIEDVTTICGLWFELDQDISTYRSPQDLLMVKNVNLGFSTTGNLMDAVKEQRELVSQYYDKEKAWADNNLRKRIIASSTKYGDLRFRNLEIADYPYTNVSSYYTSLFGGIFTLRNTHANKPVMVFESEKSPVSGEIDHGHVEFNLDSPELLGFLFANNILSDSAKFFKDKLFLLQHQLDFLLFKAASENDKEMNLVNMSASHKKGLINKLFSAGKLSDDYFELEKCVSKISKNEEVVIGSSEFLSGHLLHPSESLESHTKAIVWQMLNGIRQRNELLFFAFSKSSMYTEYKNWNSNYQDWVIAELVNNPHIYSRLIP